MHEIWRLSAAPKSEMIDFYLDMRLFSGNPAATSSITRSHLIIDVPEPKVAAPNTLLTCTLLAASNSEQLTTVLNISTMTMTVCRTDVAIWCLVILLVYHGRAESICLSIYIRFILFEGLA